MHDDRRFILVALLGVFVANASSAQPIPPIALVEAPFGGVASVAADFDGDGDNDFFAVGGGQAVLLRNDPNAEFGFEEIVLVDGFQGAPFSRNPVLRVSDLDGDGDMDVVGLDEINTNGGRQDGVLYWYENLNTNPPSFDWAWISLEILYPKPLLLADLTGDGRDDVILSVDRTDDPTPGDPSPTQIVMFRNDLATTGGWSRLQITPEGGLSASSLATADFDGDGHVDLVGASEDDRHIYWYRSSGGANPTFTPNFVWSSTSLRPVAAADMDNDGDPDLLYGLRGSDTIAGVYWFENIGAAFEVSHLRFLGVTGGADSLAPVDFDGDGDRDIVYGNTFTGRTRV
ncbi:MAG: VCBS repeat-containing protein, partial [Planctomycetota bacterium]|nr:VCBS repeat-containing protein [Planctomycetota bacterium]